MSTTSPAVIPTLQVFSAVPDPTAQYGSPATNVQIQNASPFIITVTVDGEQFTIQSFTAQTLPCGKTGTTLTILPTNGPAGNQGSITCVWLGNHETAPMGDSQLTGAAQYAQGLGTTVGTFATASVFPGSGPSFNVNLSPITRTLIIKYQWQMATTQLETPRVEVQGVNSTFFYYSAPAYLVTSLLTPPNTTLVATVIVPINALLDPVITVRLRGSSLVNPAGMTATAYGDTALFDESTFYNGKFEISTVAQVAAGNYTIINGPKRLLTASLTTAGVTDAFLLLVGWGRILESLSAGQTALTFPPNTLLQKDQTIQLQMGSGTAIGNIGWSYP